MCPCHPDAILFRTQRSDHPGAFIHPLATGGCPPITAAIILPLGHLHLDLAGDKFPVLAVHAPGFLTGIVNDVCTRRTNIFSGFVTFLLFLNRMKTWILTRIRQLTIPSYRQRQSRNFLTIHSVLQLSPIMLTLVQLQFPEIIWKVAQSILIAFSDDAPPLLHRPLELHSHNRPSDVLQAVK